ncbi:MAG TPA: ribose-5-phosphate isomerase RpiA [Candidatus Acidoferrales bacterium]|nr:ribose-5-phosphate isomerase RpiA [Candidatus Acidoferrales bacterium]
MEPSEQNEWKRAAAVAAADLVEDGMVLGLGTGSTTSYFINELGRRLAEDGLRITGIPTSDQTEAQARKMNIPLTSFAEHAQIDLTIDGADEVEFGSLSLIKGHGGALLREKIVAFASKRMVIVADETKLVEQLGSLVSVPVEVVRFGWQATGRRLTQIGGNPSLRLGPDKKPFVTDGGNYVMDCAFGPIVNAKEIAHHLDHVIGAVEHGLFLGFTKEVIIGGRDGVRMLKKSEG